MNTSNDQHRRYEQASGGLPSPYVLLREPLGVGEESLNGDWPAEGRVHLREYWRVLLRYRWVILALLILSVVSTTVITFTMRPRFTGVARIEIERRGPKVAPSESVDEQGDDFSYDQKYDYYQTQFKILQSRTIAARVIRALALESDPRFAGDGEPGITGLAIAKISGVVSGVVDRFAGLLGGSEHQGEPSADPVGDLGVPVKLIEEYLDRLSIIPVPNSRLVDVSFKSTDSTLAADVANRHIEEYVNAELEERVDLNDKAKRFLEQEIAKARDRVVAAEASLNAYRKANRVLDVDGTKMDIVSERLADLNSRYTEAQAERIKLEGQYELIKKRDYQSLPDVVSNLLLAELKQHLAVAEAQRAEIEKRFKPGYPKMKEAMERERQLRQRLQGEIANIVGGIESGYLAAKSREESLKKELEEQRETALGQKDVAADYGTLQRDVDTARDVYGSLLKKLKDIDVTEEIKLSKVSVVDRAITPTEPSFPNKPLFIGLSAAGGIGLGALLALFLNYMDNTLRSADDVRDRIQLPVLGVVPAFDSPALEFSGYGYRDDRPKIKAPGDEASGSAGGVRLPTELVLSSHPRSLVSESYRTIRTKILLGNADRPTQVILFTSAAPGEGKTLTAVNQALALVQTGGRVLVIDADIRRPRIHRLFGTPNGHGLSTYLAGQSDLDQSVHEAPLDGMHRSVANGSGMLTGTLHVIPAGPMPPNPAELLGSRRMRDTLTRLRQSYDYILIDTPPVLLATDAVLLSMLSDGVVLVVRGEQTPIPAVRRAKEDLENARVKILGVVLNDVDVMSRDYKDSYGRYTSYAYEVTSQDTA